MLAFPDFNLPFTLCTDASSFAVGGVLSQVQIEKSRVICYTGRSLNPAERSYGTTENGCLALVYAVKKLDPYPKYSKVTSVVDHSASQLLLSLKQPMGMFARWIELLQAYDMTIILFIDLGRTMMRIPFSRRAYPTSPESEDVEVDDFLDIIGENFDFTTPKVSQPAVRAITTTPQLLTSHPKLQQEAANFPYPT